jgi:RNA polymerase sigma factor (sigma-70 family)
MQFQIYRARETELIEGCRRQEHTAQKAVYNQMSGKMFALCCRYVKDRMEAEDVLVTSFTKVFEHINQFTGQGSFEGWVRRIVVNESLSYLRKNKSMYLETDLDAAEREVDVSNITGYLEADDLLKLIAELPPGYRIVFNMNAIDGYSHKEIAEHLGISENTSKSQLSRARSFLQAKLLEIETKSQQKLKEQ